MRPWPFNNQTRLPFMKGRTQKQLKMMKAIKQKCFNHLEQMKEAGDEVTPAQLRQFAYHQIPFNIYTIEENRNLALEISREVYREL